MGRAQLASISSILGLLLLTIGFSLILMSPQVQAQDEEREFEGARECRSCHRTLGSSFAESAHHQTLVSTEDEEVQILADFSTGEELRMVQLPNVQEPRPFTANDIAYVLGSGRQIQRYLYDFGDGVYMVLPAEWNTVTNAWQAYDTGEEWLSESYNFNLNCAYCHVTGFQEEGLEWEEAGVQCEACHGAGSYHVELMDDLEFINNEEDREELHGSINIALDPATCGQCHSQGISDSAHPYPSGYSVGDDLAAAWSLVPEGEDSHWAATGQGIQANMQYNEWLLTAHATSHETATSSDYYELECLSCHSAGYRRAVRILDTSDEDPEVLPIPEIEAERLPYGITCATCHNPHDTSASEEDFDAAQAAYLQCVDCHQSAGEIAGLHHPVREVYEGLPLVDEVAPIVGSHFSEEDGPSCTTCHMPTVTLVDGTTRASHFMNPISPATALDIAAVQDSCTQCHDVEAEAMQSLIDSVQEKTRARYEVANAALTDDSPEWLRTSLMVVENEGSWGIHNINYTNSLLNAVEVELGLVSGDIAPLVLPQIPTQAAPTETAPVNLTSAPEPIIFGLTLPALIILGIALGIIAFAGYAFFIRKDEA